MDRHPLYLTRRMWCTLLGVCENKEVEGGFSSEGESRRKRRFGVLENSEMYK